MDSHEGARDTRSLPAPRSSREGLAEVPNAAFAEGLLSERTHSHRLGQLFGPCLVDPQRLVGDLTLQGRGSSLVDATRNALRELRAAALTPGGRSLLLLALDRLAGEVVLLGRQDACDVVLDDPTVSRRHVQIAHRGGTMVICDLASRNGTVLNGRRVGRAALRRGDLLELGGAAIKID